MHPVTLSGLFVRQARRAGLPQIRRHDLRHLVASILLARASTPSGSASLPGQAAVCVVVWFVDLGDKWPANVKVPREHLGARRDPGAVVPTGVAAGGSEPSGAR